MRGARKAALVSLLLIPAVAGAFVVQDRASREGGRLFAQVLDLVSARFVDSVNSADLFEKAARGLVSQLQDPYSELMSPRQLTQFNTSTAGRYGGIGMRIEEQPGKGVTIVAVFPNTPAEAAGIREGDIIVSIDTLSVRGWTSRRVADSLTGTPGSKVTVSFARPGVIEPIKATFTRALIRVPAVPYAILFEGKIGYIPLQGFNETSTNELATAVNSIQAQGARGLVLDLRGNPGGFLDQSLSITNLFLKEGQEIASVRGRNVEPQTYYAREKPIAPTIPLVILTDQFSASASEIVAGALQDHDRAVIVGSTSFGKGLVQTVFNLDGGYALKMTTGKWYTPSGRSIQKERRLTEDGAWVEVDPDSLEEGTPGSKRPEFKSDAGRTIYGGGAITPDLVIAPDTFLTVEQDFLRATVSKQQDRYVVIYDYAVELKSRVEKPDFEIQPAWREELYRRLTAKGIEVDRAVYDRATPWIDRELGLRITRLAYGDSTARRRTLADDSQLRAALDLLRRGQTQQDLFGLVTARAGR